MSEAWAQAIDRVAAEPGGRLVHLVMTVTEPGTEVAAVRSVIDDALDGAGAQSVDTVAETIFPSSLYPDPSIDWCPGISSDLQTELDEAARALYDSYGQMLPLLTTASGNSRGTYFGRMISWPGKAAGGPNQLAARVLSLRREANAGRRTNNTLDMDIAADSTESVDGLQIYAATDKRTRGFPCLTHIDFTLYKGRLHCTAVYRHQYLVEKAYGNMLGLSALMHFLCQQSGHELGELVVHATMADAQRGDFPAVAQLAARARSAVSASRAAEDIATSAQHPPLAALQTAWSAAAVNPGANGTGIDLVEISLFASLVQTGGQTFLDAAWTAAEQSDAEDSVERLAARWAGKEAVMKVLQRGIGDVDPLEVEIRTASDGSPRVVLHGGAYDIAEAQGLDDWNISLCHEQGWAAAIACAHRSVESNETEGAQDG